MKLTYDRDRNIAYLRLRPKGIGVETIRIRDELNIDIAPDGSVYGIELLNANEQLRASDGGQLVLVDEAEGREVAVPLSPPRPKAHAPIRHGGNPTGGVHRGVEGRCVKPPSGRFTPPLTDRAPDPASPRK